MRAFFASLAFLLQIVAAIDSALQESLISGPLGKITPVPTIFQFGDSLSDPGNALIAFPEIHKRLNTSPYGETFFHHPAGRESDGRLLIDFLATSFGLPLLDPFLLRIRGRDYRRGVNFATGGASALGFGFFVKNNISLGARSRKTFPLDVQLQWFQDFKNTSLLSSNLGTHPSPGDFSSALYVVGEIGGNDYGFMKKAGLDYDCMLDLVPAVIDSIQNFIQDLYNLGARKFLVINIPLQGCNPDFLVARRARDRLDPLGCVADFNAVSDRHNSLLRIAVEDLRARLRDAIFAYGDFAGVIRAVLENPRSYGITESRLPCCGSRWRNTIVDCVDGQMKNGVPVTGMTCSNPSSYVFWNGVHFTDRFYQITARAFLSGQFVYPVADADQ